MVDEFDLYEADAVLLQELQSFLNVPKKRVLDSIHLVEEHMEWYDHAAAAFLLYDNPTLAFQKIQALCENYKIKNKDWCKIVFSPLFEPSKADVDGDTLWMKLVEVLYLLKQFKILSELDIAQSRDTLLNPLRRKLFTIIDDQSVEDGKELVKFVNSKISVSESTDPDWCLELHFLHWIANCKISEEELVKLLADRSREKFYPVSIKEPAKSFSTKFNIKKGLCIIINQMNFTSPQIAGDYREANPNLTFRYGSEVDRDKIADTFKMLRHEIRFYSDLKYNQFLDTLSRIASEPDIERFDGLVVCILSHGERDCVFSADSIPIPLDLIKSKFDARHCPAMKTKPKLFFLQACQGQENQSQVEMVEYERDGSLPAHSNFFEAWATVPGFSSYRSTFRGAVFIHELCAVLQKDGHKESLLDLMTNVNQRVASWECGNGVHKRKQICNTTYCLTKGVQFQRSDEEQFVKAIIDQVEREILTGVIQMAACRLYRSDRLNVRRIINTWEHR